MSVPRVVNLTRNIVRFYPKDRFKPPATFMPQGEVGIRVKFHKQQPVVSDSYLIPLVEMEVFEVIGLPEPAEKTVYIVPGIVLPFVRNRPDVVAPDTGALSVVADDDGNTIGVQRFIRNHTATTKVEYKFPSATDMES